MREFAPRSDGSVAATIDRDEAMLLQNLASQLTRLLRDADERDPAVARLFPDAYPEDAAASAEFRRFTRDGLVDRKLTYARTMVESLSLAAESGELILAPPAAQAWLRALTDIRLTLASRLGIESDDQQSGDDPILQELYDWLGFIQNSLVEAIDP